MSPAPAGRLFTVIIAVTLLLKEAAPALSQSIEFESLTDALKSIATAPAANEASAAKGSGANGADSISRRVFQQTLAPSSPLLMRLQGLFGTYFDGEIDLTPVLAKLVRQAAVAAVPGHGQLLYNPAHMLLLHVPERWQEGDAIRVATLEDVGKILQHDRPANVALAAYGSGFEQFRLLSELMKEDDARDTLEVIWNSVPRSSEDKEMMRYLLVRPIEQAAAVRNETKACQGTIDQFIDDVRAGKQASVPAIAGLSSIVRPTRFIHYENQIFLVLGESLVARYHVLAQFDVGTETCRVAWVKPIFAM